MPSLNKFEKSKRLVKYLMKKLPTTLTQKN